MTQEVKLRGGSKQLADCALADIDEKAAGAKPASTIRDNVSPPAMYALLGQEMRRAGAETVADLGDDKFKRWEASLGLHYASADQVLKALAKGLRDPGASG